MKSKIERIRDESHAVITFCMPVYNRPVFVRSAIESMLAQTHRELEIIVVDDGSTDETPDVVEAFDDSRVRLIRRERNSGNLVCRNIAFGEAQGDYIAVMDSDDLCHPERAALQMKTLASGFDICGSWIVKGQTPFKIDGSWTPPEMNPELTCFALFGSPFANPSTMMTRNFLKSQNYRFDQEYFPAADYHALAKAVVLSDARVTVLQRNLVFRRMHANAISSEKKTDQENAGDKVREMLLRAIGVDSDEAIKLHNKLVQKNELSPDDRQILRELYFSTLPDLKPEVFATAASETILRNKLKGEMEKQLANNPEVSIIIPVYNTSKFIRACIESALEQKDLRSEIILVDDGSTDDSGAICNEYASENPNVKVVSKSNGGLSSARNAGMDIARGEYVYFLDSDDLVVPNVVANLLELARRNNSDVVVGSHDTFSENTDERVFRFGVIEQKKYDGELLEHYAHNRFGRPAWNKLISRRIAERLTFPIGLLHEDELYCVELFRSAKSVVVSPEVTYLYRQREGSITSETTEQHVRDITTILDTVIETMQRLPFTEKEKADYSAAIALKSRHLIHTSRGFEGSDELRQDIQRALARAEAHAIEGEMNRYANTRVYSAESDKFAQLEDPRLLTNVPVESVRLKLKDVTHLDRNLAARLGVLMSGAKENVQSIARLERIARRRRYSNMQLFGYALRHNGPGEHVGMMPRWMRAWSYVLSLKKGNATESPK